jgi:hypothetical protein
MYRILFLLLLTLPSIAKADCPDLTSYYPGGQADWPALEQQLVVLMPECLQSAEFFALYGAAQLNSGQVPNAIESLERALLLDPEQGAAQIDYAQALFLQGELFTALELNNRLLERQDLPEDLQPLIEQRQRTWQDMTRQRSIQLDLLAGYDDNLNGAPDSSQITLTLSGEPVLLTLNDESQPVSGPYLNLRLAGGIRQLALDYQHNWAGEVRGRFSEHSDSDLAQLNGRYSYIRPGHNRSWQFNAAMSNLFFGGSPLYTATETSARYQPRVSVACKPYYNLAAQHQYYHKQDSLNGLETKASVGANCPFGGSSGNQLFSAEAGVISNQALKSTRPGDDRRGWQATLDWQFITTTGVYRAQINHTQLNDRSGYSELLEDGAKRRLSSGYVLLQYRRPLRADTTLLINIYHQRQRSNIELFQTVDTTFELGLSLAL